MWSIPAKKMKMRRPHRVPLALQSLAIIRELQEVTGSGRWLFPSVRTSTRPISQNTLNAALRRLGYGTEEMCVHGFRGMAATRLNEMGRWAPDAIERQLAHQEANAVRRAYTHKRCGLRRMFSSDQASCDWRHLLSITTRSVGNPTQRSNIIGRQVLPENIQFLPSSKLIELVTTKSAVTAR
jgi:hypothetical protein